MFTPALLILASASLVATALNRLGRTVDRTRRLLKMTREETEKQGYSQETLKHALAHFDRRVTLGERAMMSFCGSVGIFVIVSLTIAIDQLNHDSLPWLPVGMTILGMGVMLFGIGHMLAESMIAGDELRKDIHSRLGS